ncbi:ESX secretion-associated protein EspG [Nocardia altamirensis]|uniref:ESX secretion-associated protein EspG n=1 Tax=Nocardia altamirensis TaxID=472158 RepID=UPI000840936C|nr:ESX secretion-associated protein EspG [Nocardia altamirensis]
MTDWRFTGLEFELLWSAYGRDRLPYPLQYRAEAADFSDLKQQREAAADALMNRYAEDLERALDVLLEPEARIESKGLGETPSNVFRFHAGIRGGLGATLVQLPGHAADTGSDVIVSWCPATQVAKRAVAALPRTPPGTHPPIEVRREEVAADRERHVRRPYEVSMAEQLDRIFKRRRLGLGEITVFAGAAVDARPAFGRGFWWMDYEDGRYFVKTGDPIVARPLDAATMTAEINRLLARTQRFFREDRDHDRSIGSQW